ncbi:MAG: histidine--tRNA ligase [Clostridiales bacterium]|jgi:histidyl-tRNA synthetase|nr:histidine--tRNA ligase [Clostridiales bacterium]
MLTKAPRGTKDVPPNEVYKWRYAEDAIRALCACFGFQEIRVPVFEHTELYERGVGDTTDVVQKEMYTFEDKGGRSVTLRPEGTAGVVRAYLENNLYAEAAPAKLFYLMSCYRYEKPQAGRLREFHQFGVETFGASSPEADAETISLAMQLLAALGLDGLKLFINSVGCPVCRTEYNKKLRAYFGQYTDRLCQTCLARLEKNPMRIIDCKNPVCKEIGKGAPMLIDGQCGTCEAHFNSVREILSSLGIAFETDPTIVRGLDYYTTTVFEIKAEELVVCGGGRYNNLVARLGGADTPGIGFGMGLERLIMTLERNNLLPEKPEGAEVYLASVGDAAARTAQRLTYELRRAGIRAESDLMKRSVKAQMKYADKINAKYVAVLGEDELSAGRVNVKRMSTGEQVPIDLDGFASGLKQLL